MSPSDYQPPADHRAPLRVRDSIGFIGVGNLGATLARALAGSGAHVEAVTARHPARAEVVAATLPDCRSLPDPGAVVALVDAVILAVPDDAIAPLDARLTWRRGQCVVHLSGARGVAALPHVAASGAVAAALHPLMIFPRPAADASSALARLAGCTWALTCLDPTATTELQKLVSALGGRVVHLDESDRVPYHLAAVLASNAVVALLSGAVGIWESFGISSQTALEALLPLLRATVENLADLGPTDALSGPIARGDVGTLSAHLTWLAARARTTPAASASDPTALLDAYRALATLAMPLAQARGTLSDAAAQDLRSTLRDIR